MRSKLPPGAWSQSNLAALFGLPGPSLGHYLNGQSYPTLQTLQKFEAVMGWPVADQVQLIPPFWEWPLQRKNTAGIEPSDPTDFRYAVKLRQIIWEWAEANPRTLRPGRIRQHPSIPARTG